MVDIKRYYRVREKGLSKIFKIEDGLEIHFKRFDPENGSELPPEIQKIVTEELLKKKGELQRDIDSINSILQEVESFSKEE